MPRVPVLNSQIRSTPTRYAQQNTNAPIEAFGGGNQGQMAAFGKLGDAVTGVINEEKQRADDAFGKEMYSRASRRKNEIIWGTEESPGLVSKKGKEAFNVADDGLMQWQKYEEELLTEASNDSQKQFIRNVFLKEGDEMHGSLSRHSSTEIQNYRKDTTMAAVEAAANDAVMNYAMPGKVADSLKLQEGAIREFMKGQPEEEIKNTVGKAYSKTHAAVLDRMVTLGEDLKAGEYLKQVKPQITDAASLMASEKRVEEGSTRGESRRISDQILAKSGTMTEAVDVLKGMKVANAKVYDATLDRIKSEYVVKDAAERQHNETVMNGFYNKIEDSKSLDGINNTAAWDALKPNQKDALLAKHKRMLEGLDVATDPRAMNDLIQLASNPTTRDAFLKTDLVTGYADKLNKTDMSYMQKFQGGLRRQDAEALAKLDGIMTDDQIVKGAALNVLKINPNHKGNAAQVAEFRDAVSQRIANEARERGRKLSDEEKADLANSMAVKVVTEEGLWNTRMPFYKVPAGQAFEIEVDKLPPREVLKIKDVLIQQGRPVNDENIIRLYQMKYMSKQAGVR